MASKERAYQQVIDLSMGHLTSPPVGETFYYPSAVDIRKVTLSWSQHGLCDDKNGVTRASPAGRMQGRVFATKLADSA